MDARIIPHPLAGSVEAIASKSDAHRILICAALADGPTTVSLHGMSRDIRATMDCLEALGARIEPAGPGAYRVWPVAGPARPCTLPCGESGSTLRFMLPVAAALGAPAAFTGEGRLPQRPLGDLTRELERHGAAFTAPALPFQIGGRLRGGAFCLPGDVSSQFITGLLLCAPLLEGGCSIRLTTPMESAGYVRLTCAAMARFGVEVEQTEEGWAVAPGQRYRSPGAIEAEGDWSNAAFWLCAGALGAPVSVTGLNPASPQGDRAIAHQLRALGARVEEAGGRYTVSPGGLRGATIDAAEIPDLIPVLAMVAACAEGRTEIIRAGRLRLKESDRLASTAAAIRALGGRVEERPEGLTIWGGPLAGGTVDGCNDHRIVMAAAIAAIRCQNHVTISSAQAADKSYPTFWAHYKQLGGHADGVSIR